MSALLPKADIAQHGGNVRFVPEADINATLIPYWFGLERRRNHVRRWRRGADRLPVQYRCDAALLLLAVRHLHAYLLLSGGENFPANSFSNETGKACCHTPHTCLRRSLPPRPISISLGVEAVSNTTSVVG
jgi:hypothetical protein